MKKNYLKENGFFIGEEVCCQCLDDDEPWKAIVDRDSNGIYFLSFDGGYAYYPDSSDSILLCGS